MKVVLLAGGYGTRISEESLILFILPPVIVFNPVSTSVTFQGSAKLLCTVISFLPVVKSVQPDGRFGVIETNEDNMITAFAEKCKEDTGWINAGYFVLEPQIFDYLQDDTTIFERAPLEKLANEQQLNAPDIIKILLSQLPLNPV